MTNKEIGERIIAARESRGLNKKQLAQKIGVADSTVKRYEEGEINKIKLPIIECIANALNVNPMWLIGKSNEKEYAAGVNEIKNSFIHIHNGIASRYDELSDENKKIIDKQIQYLLYEQNQE